MGKAALERIGVVSALRLDVATPEARWELSALAGRLAELSADGPAAGLTLAFALVLDAQRQGEPVAWVTSARRFFYPPDAAEGGVDLDALAVVRVAESRQAFRAVDHLARSGGFGLLVLDLEGEPQMPTPVQTRLAGLAAKHATLILCLTRKREDQPSLGSLVSLRAEAVRQPRGADRFVCEARVLKDKRRGPGWAHAELCRGPDGLR